MQLVEIPLTTDQLAHVPALAVDHRRLGLHEPLDAGQLVLLHDLDGEHRGAWVARLEFGLHSTTYHLVIGAPVSLVDALRVGAYRRDPAPMPIPVPIPGRLPVAV